MSTIKVTDRLSKWLAGDTVLNQNFVGSAHYATATQSWIVSETTGVIEVGWTDGAGVINVEPLQAPTAK